MRWMGSQKGSKQGAVTLSPLSGIHLGQDVVDSEAVHQLERLGRQLWVFLGRLRFADVDLGRRG